MREARRNYENAPSKKKPTPAIQSNLASVRVRSHGGRLSRPWSTSSRPARMFAWLSLKLDSRAWSFSFENFLSVRDDALAFSEDIAPTWGGEKSNKLKEESREREKYIPMYFNDDVGRTFVVLNERFEVVSGERDSEKMEGSLVRFFTSSTATTTFEDRYLYLSSWSVDLLSSFLLSFLSYFFSSFVLD